MASIASNVTWGSSPNIYFDFSYEKKREGTTQYYKISVSSDPLTGASYFGYPIYVQISLDGAVKTSYTLKNASPSQWGSAISNTTGWLAVNNKTSGTTALKIRVYSGMGSSRDSTFSYSLAIDPAASGISCTTANVGSNPTITIAKSASNFTHTISYEFGTLSAPISSKTSATTITNWTIPTSFYGQIPYRSAEGTLTCDTYDGNGKYVGSSSCPFEVGTDKAICKPIVSGNVVDGNQKTAALTGDAENILIRYKSAALCTMTATSASVYSTSIKEKTINNTPVSGHILTISNVETNVFDFWAKDGRDYEGTDKVVVNTLIPYIMLSANVTGQRTDPTSGNATISIEGNFYNGNFGRTDNYLNVKYRFHTDSDYISVTPKITNNTYSVTIPLSGLTYTQAFRFEVVVNDALEEITKFVTIAKGIPVFDWGEDDFRFNVPVTFVNEQSIINTPGTIFHGDANEIKNTAMMRVGDGTINAPSTNGFLLSFAPNPGYVVFQICCNFNGGGIKIRTHWYGTWYEWIALT